MDRLPVFVRLTGKRCLVVGGGVVAERKVKILLRTGAAVTVVSPVLNDCLSELLEAGRIAHVARSYASRDVDCCWLAIAASDDRAVNRAVSADCERAGRLCNVVDDEAASSFIMPAIVDRSPVLIAIGTGGAAPVLAQQLKTRIEALLPARIGELAARAGGWRAQVKKRFATTRERRRFWQRFFDGPIAEAYLANRRADAEGLVRRELIGDSAASRTPGGEGWIVGAGPGDPGLVTLRAQQLIARADVVLYDRLVSPPVLDMARKDAELVHVGKRSASKTNPQEDTNRLLVSLVSRGKRVCRLKGGDPFVFGRGGEEVRALRHAGLPFQVVPGISAALGCAAYAGIPLTHRGVSGSVTFATAHPGRDPAPEWPALLKSGHTLCLYMAVGALERVRSALLANGVRGELPAAIVERGTTPEQRCTITTVSRMSEAVTQQGIEPPALVFIGEVVAMADRQQWFGNSPIKHHAVAKKAYLIW